MGLWLIQNFCEGFKEKHFCGLHCKSWGAVDWQKCSVHVKLWDLKSSCFDPFIRHQAFASWEFSCELDLASTSINKTTTVELHLLILPWVQYCTWAYPPMETFEGAPGVLGSIVRLYFETKLTVNKGFSSRGLSHLHSRKVNEQLSCWFLIGIICWRKWLLLSWQTEEQSEVRDWLWLLRCLLQHTSGEVRSCFPGLTVCFDSGVCSSLRILAYLGWAFSPILKS